MSDEKLKKILNDSAIPLIALMAISLVIAVWFHSVGVKLFLSFFIIFLTVIFVYRIFYYKEK